MILRGQVLLCALPLSRYCSILPLTGRWRVLSYWLWYSCEPSRPLEAAVSPAFFDGIEGMILQGQVLLCALPLSLYCSILPFDDVTVGIILRGLVLLCPPLSIGNAAFSR